MYQIAAVMARAFPGFSIASSVRQRVQYSSSKNERHGRTQQESDIFIFTARSAY